MRVLLTILAVTAGMIADNWVVFNVNPQNAIITIDSTDVHNVRDGILQLMVPSGKHRFSCESPYFEPQAKDFEVNDTTKTSIWIDLTPKFSFLVVENPMPDSDVYIDGEKVGQKRAESSKLSEGFHRISVIKGNECWYDENIYLAKGEKKTRAIEANRMKPVPVGNVAGLFIPVLEGASTPVTVQDESHTEKEINDKIESECGSVSVHSPVPGATVLVNGKEVGQTPFIIKKLYPGVKYRITLRMDGYKEASRLVKVPRNKMVDLEIKMKKL